VGKVQKLGWTSQDKCRDRMWQISTQHGRRVKDAPWLAKVYDDGV